ncbi:hypothetical protein [Clostridium sp. KNHs214]|uniref:hypothetical protein n=1 Tax=Clostridium sp. KNHs214 TaxID=1540257 RepID=UPI0005531672|nr:hypothetical protein [Clostridium sp. KNHs214]
MLKKIKNIFLGFLTIIFLFTQKCYAVNTSKIINANPIAQTENCWIDTSTWELRPHSEKRYKRVLKWHSTTKYRWERRVIPLPRPTNTDGYRVYIPEHYSWPDGHRVNGEWRTNYEKSYYIVAVWAPYTYKWQQFDWVAYTFKWESFDWIPSGFTANVSNYNMVIDKKQRFIYTEWHKKEDDSPACLELECKLSNVKLNGRPAKVKELNIYHKVARFNGKTDTVKPYSSSVTGDNGHFIGKLKYPHAGSEKSELHIVAQVETVFPITKCNSKGNKYIYNKKVIVPIDVKLNVPVNGYYTINTGSTKNLDKGLEFLGTENHFVIKK